MVHKMEAGNQEKEQSFCPFLTGHQPKTTKKHKKNFFDFDESRRGKCKQIQRPQSVLNNFTTFKQPNFILKYLILMRAIWQRKILPSTSKSGFWLVVTIGILTIKRENKFSENRLHFFFQNLVKVSCLRLTKQLLSLPIEDRVNLENLRYKKKKTTMLSALNFTQKFYLRFFAEEANCSKEKKTVKAII